jgi:hypothetical protein
VKAIHLIQASVFLFTLTLEVKVRAADSVPESRPEVSSAGAILSLPKDTALIEIPAHCLLETDRCAVKTSARGQYKFPMGRGEIVMSANTSVVKGEGSGLTFMAGALWIRTPQPLTIETEFGEIHTAGNERAEFWIVRRDGRIWAQAIESSVYLRPRGGQMDIKLDAGEELWLGGVQLNGVAMSGIAQPISIATFSNQWALVYPESPKAFEVDLDRVKVQVGRAAAVISQTQGGLLQRSIASEKQDVAKKAQEQAAIDAHNKKYRDLFRQKVLGN